VKWRFKGIKSVSRRSLVSKACAAPGISPVRPLDIVAKIQSEAQPWTPVTPVQDRCYPPILTPKTTPCSRQPNWKMRFLSRVHAVGAFGAPHPSPLPKGPKGPKGEGGVSARRITLTVQLQIQREVESFPLPGGPGGPRGEG